MMLIIHDEQLARDLQQIAEREQRNVEDVLKAMIAQYPAKSQLAATQVEQDEAVLQVRRKAYSKARRYWQSVGDVAKAALTDGALDEQFGAFDEHGIPRLKSELSTEPPVGSLAYAARIAEKSGLRSGNPNLAQNSEQILEDHFADDFMKRMRGEDDAQ
jgi:hypothetical protein